MSTVPADFSTPSDSPAAPVAPARHEGRHCGNCGFEDSGHYCSRCGEPLHGTRDTVLQILWADLVEGPVHNGFALAKTTWLMLARPRRFFDGVLRRQHGMTHVPFFLAPVWRRVSHKPHGVPNAVKYFVLIYTLTALGAWAADVSVFPQIPVLIRGHVVKLPSEFSEPVFLLFVVFAAAMYSKSVSLLLGGKIPTDLLTRFMLYLNGFALIPFVAMAVFRNRNLWGFSFSFAFWLYALFVLPQLALPRIFKVSRRRLGFAQAGAAAANLLLAVAMIFTAGVVANVLMPHWNDPAALAATLPRESAESGISAVRRAASSDLFPLDTMFVRFPTVFVPSTRDEVRRAGHAPRTARPRPR